METESESVDLPEGNTYTAVKTGDTTNIMIYVIMMLAAVGCAGGVLFDKKRRVK